MKQGISITGSDERVLYRNFPPTKRTHEFFTGVSHIRRFSGDFTDLENVRRHQKSAEFVAIFSRGYDCCLMSIWVFAFGGKDDNRSFFGKVLFHEIFQSS